MLTNTEDSYGWISKFLHWVTALAIFGLIGVGMYMTGLDKNDPARADITEIHKAVGTLLLLMVVLRLIWHRITPTPALPAALQGKERTLPIAIKHILYVLMLATPIAGIAMSQLYGKPINIFDYYQLPMLLAENKDIGHFVHEMHEIFAWTMLVVVILHAAGSFKHHIKDRGGETDILRRML